MRAFLLLLLLCNYTSAPKRFYNGNLLNYNLRATLLYLITKFFLNQIYYQSGRLTESQHSPDRFLFVSIFQSPKFHIHRMNNLCPIFISFRQAGLQNQDLSNCLCPSSTFKTVAPLLLTLFTIAPLPEESTITVVFRSNAEKR